MSRRLDHCTVHRHGSPVHRHSSSKTLQSLQLLPITLQRRYFTTQCHHCSQRQPLQLLPISYQCHHWFGLPTYYHCLGPGQTGLSNTATSPTHLRRFSRNVARSQDHCQAVTASEAVDNCCCLMLQLDKLHSCRSRASLFDLVGVVPNVRQLLQHAVGKQFTKLSVQRCIALAALQGPSWPPCQHNQ
jgi:hypothetical protein